MKRPNARWKGWQRNIGARPTSKIASKQKNETASGAGLATVPRHIIGLRFQLRLLVGPTQTARRRMAAPRERRRSRNRSVARTCPRWGVMRHPANLRP
jgi:hypothetical protein